MPEEINGTRSVYEDLRALERRHAEVARMAEAVLAERKEIEKQIRVLEKTTRERRLLNAAQVIQSAMRTFGHTVQPSPSSLRSRFVGQTKSTSAAASVTTVGCGSFSTAKVGRGSRSPQAAGSRADSSRTVLRASDMTGTPTRMIGFPLRTLSAKTTIRGRTRNRGVSCWFVIMSSSREARHASAS